MDPQEQKRQEEGPIKLCVIGGNEDGEWLPYQMANQVVWDNKAPSANRQVPQQVIVQREPSANLGADLSLEPEPLTSSASSGSSGYEYVRQSDNSSKCWAVCKSSDYGSDPDFGWINSLSQSCVMPNSYKKSSISCSP